MKCKLLAQLVSCPSIVLLCLWFDVLSIQPTCYQFCSVAMDSRSKWLDTVTWLLIGGLSQELNLNCGFPVSAPPALLHLWQASQPLPSLEPVLVVIDLSNLYTQQSPSPCRWHISQNYALVFMSYPWGSERSIPDTSVKSLLCGVGLTSRSAFASWPQLCQTSHLFAILVWWLFTWQPAETGSLSIADPIFCGAVWAHSYGSLQLPNSSQFLQLWVKIL